MKLQAGQNGASSTMSTPPLGLFCPPEGDFVRSSKRDSMDCGHVVPKMVKAFKPYVFKNKHTWDAYTPRARPYCSASSLSFRCVCVILVIIPYIRLVISI